MGPAKTLQQWIFPVSLLMLWAWLFVTLQQWIMNVNRVPFVKMNRLFTYYYRVKVMTQMYIAEIYSPTNCSDSTPNCGEKWWWIPWHRIDNKNHQPNKSQFQLAGCTWRIGPQDGRDVHGFHNVGPVGTRNQMAELKMAAINAGDTKSTS